MMKALLLLVAVPALLSGCEALQPFVHADKDGYEAGVKGAWPAVAEQARRIVQPEGGDGKAVIP